MPTFTYTVYGNYSRGLTDEAYRARVAAWGARPWTTDDHPDYGLSTYNYHTDGSGICYASRLRPMITMRPGFLSYLDARGSGLRHFPADTHLLDWLEAMGHDFDVITDDDVHAEGVDLLQPYKVVLTTSHPEYHTRGTLDALSAYTAQGGRLMYLGGNGFYWRVALNPAWPGAVEIRRGEGGIRVWAAEPGEYYNSFDGQYGGLWRRNGRPPQQLAGVGFTSQGRFEGSYYRRQPAAHDPRVAWIFDGVEDDVLGDFGLSGGGAAGFELDRADSRLGTPAHALVLATSEGHNPENFILVHEEQLGLFTTWPREPAAQLIRADMVYFETPNGGAVFSVGSITFCGSLAHNHYDNNIARLVNNVLRRFRTA
jgi:N,N-dimethylformamidase